MQFLIMPNSSTDRREPQCSTENQSKASLPSSSPLTTSFVFTSSRYGSSPERSPSPARQPSLSDRARRKHSTSAASLRPASLTGVMPGFMPLSTQMPQTLISRPEEDYFSGTTFPTFSSLSTPPVEAAEYCPVPTSRSLPSISSLSQRSAHRADTRISPNDRMSRVASSPLSTPPLDEVDEDGLPLGHLSTSNLFSSPSTLWTITGPHSQPKVTAQWIATAPGSGPRTPPVPRSASTTVNGKHTRTQARIRPQSMVEVLANVGLSRTETHVQMCDIGGSDTSPGTRQAWGSRASLTSAQGSSSPATDGTLAETPSPGGIDGSPSPKKLPLEEIEKKLVGLDFVESEIDGLHEVASSPSAALHGMLVADGGQDKGPETSGRQHPPKTLLFN